MDLQKTAQNLKARGFSVRVFDTAAEARDAIAAELRGRTIGIGGSVTVKEMELLPLLQEHNTVYWHWTDGPAKEMREKGMAAEVYLTSVNGLAETGELVNIDGTGNRVAATLYGPQKLYFIVGQNKIAPTLEEAIWRARNIASPLNARRLNRNTPCALGEELRCYDCKSADRICNGMTIHMAPLGGVGETEVILIAEDLGY